MSVFACLPPREVGAVRLCLVNLRLRLSLVTVAESRAAQKWPAVGFARACEPGLHAFFPLGQLCGQLGLCRIELLLQRDEFPCRIAVGLLISSPRPRARSGTWRRDLVGVVEEGEELVVLLLA